MQPPRSDTLKEDFLSMELLYGLVVAMIVLVFLFAGPIANIVLIQARPRSAKTEIQESRALT